MPVETNDCAPSPLITERVDKVHSGSGPVSVAQSHRRATGKNSPTGKDGVRQSGMKCYGFLPGACRQMTTKEGRWGRIWAGKVRPGSRGRRGKDRANGESKLGRQEQKPGRLRASRSKSVSVLPGGCREPKYHLVSRGKSRAGQGAKGRSRAARVGFGGHVAEGRKERTTKWDRQDQKRGRVCPCCTRYD
ncbi:unnamed protein product [Calypogeia fissa]